MPTVDELREQAIRNFEKEADRLEGERENLRGPEKSAATRKVNELRRYARRLRRGPHPRRSPWET